ncbi:ribonuclease H-like domain-containing protein [Candidatus Pacearchaeota archaeon]|nr:ribonuclease H-like domain-containing protein [Candidatus Pacearchaeota archaeon]
MNKPKILIFDIETSPNLGYIWGKYEQNVIDFKDEWYMLCFAAKWLNNKKIITSKLSDYKLYKKDKQNDLEVIKELWKLLDEADVVIAHNGDQFDIKKSNARFIYHGLNSPSSYKSIDTKKVAKRYFNFNSNKLDDLGKYLNVGRKIKHEGFDLWLGCMNGDKKSWNKMIQYNKQDVLLLERVYKRFLGWIINHPNYGLYQGEQFACPNCGSKNLIRRGFAYTKINTYQRWICKNCGAQSQSRRCEKDTIKPRLKN